MSTPDETADNETADNEAQLNEAAQDAIRKQEEDRRELNEQNERETERATDR